MNEVSSVLALIGRFGEDEVKGILSGFMCAKNASIEHFVRRNAVDFSKQGISITHVVVRDPEGPKLMRFYESCGYVRAAQRYDKSDETQDDTLYHIYVKFLNPAR